MIITLSWFNDYLRCVSWLYVLCIHICEVLSTKLVSWIPTKSSDSIVTSNVIGAILNSRFESGSYHFSCQWTPSSPQLARYVTAHSSTRPDSSYKGLSLCSVYSLLFCPDRCRTTLSGNGWHFLWDFEFFTWGKHEQGQPTLRKGLEANQISTDP